MAKGLTVLIKKHELLLADCPRGNPGERTINDLSIPRIGYYPSRPSPGTDRQFSYRAIVFIAAGSGSFQVDNGKVEAVGPGCIWFLHPGLHYRYGPPPGKTWEEYFIDIEGSGLSRWFERGWLPRGPELWRLTSFGTLIERLRAMMRTLQEGAPSAADRAVLEVAQFLVEVRNCRSAGPPDADYSLHAALSRLHQSYANPADFEMLAQQHAISYSTFRQGVLRLTGFSPGRYLTRLRCEAAKRLLLDTTLSVKEIGRSVGISNPISFSRTFRRYAGMSAVAYRLHALRAGRRR